MAYDWQGRLDKLCGLSTAEKARVLVLVLDKPRKTRPLYFKGDDKKVLANLQELLKMHGEAGPGPGNAGVVGVSSGAVTLLALMMVQEQQRRHEEQEQQRRREEQEQQRRREEQEQQRRREEQELRDPTAQWLHFQEKMFKCTGASLTSVTSVKKVS